MTVHPPVPSGILRRHGAFWIADHLLGRPLVDRLAGSARKRLHERLRQSLQQAGDGALQPIRRTTDPTSITGDGPVLLEGAAADWPAVARWSPDFFADHYGHEEIVLMEMGPEALGDPSGQKYRTTTLRDALAGLQQGNRSYCRFLPLLNEHPALREDLDLDWLQRVRATRARDINLQLFIGGRGTSTATHNAVSATLFVQVYGTKTWRLYPPDWAFALDPPITRAPYFFSAYDPSAPSDALPLARYLRGYEVNARPGDVLYNAPFWWHKVDNPEVSIGVGYRWFAPGPTWRASPTQALLTLLSTNPPVWAAKKDFTKVFPRSRDPYGGN